MAEAARTAGVRIVTGDTKVVDRGKGDGIFINTAGIGWVPPGVEISPARVAARRRHPPERRPRPARRGDHVGPRGAPVRGRVGERLRTAGRAGRSHARHGADIHCLRDLTRGGLAAALNEIALDARVGIEIDEAAIPVAEPVAAACELLGLDPLYVANEGRLVAFVPARRPIGCWKPCVAIRPPSVPPALAL